MARRRVRPKTPPPPRKAGGMLSWLAVLAVAGFVGWIWWRAAYGTSRPVSITRSGLSSDRPAWAKWEGWIDWMGRWTSRNKEDEAIEEIPSTAGDDLDLPAPGSGTEPSPTQRAPASNSVARSTLQAPPDARSLPSDPSRASTNGTTDARKGLGDEHDALSAKREGTNVLAIQLALARRGFSSGPIDGVAGLQTRAALREFQRLQGLPVTGLIDDRTAERLRLEGGPITNYLVSADDTSRLTWVPSTWLGKASRERLDYESILELVAERTHANPKLLRQLNPSVNWNRVAPGTSLRVPAAELPSLRGRAGFVRISLREKALRVYDPASNLVAHFPCSIARKVEKRPVGELRVARLAPNPNYRFDPEIFRESPEARRIGKKLMIPPGPNNPVGTAWIGLSRPGYGIHGTPHPEDVGRTESHGCFRLANWNAEFLMKAAWVGMPVIVEP